MVPAKLVEEPAEVNEVRDSKQTRKLVAASVAAVLAIVGVGLGVYFGAKDSEEDKQAFETTDEVEVIEDEMFFSPLLFLRNKENIFKSEKRQYPVDMGYGLSKNYSVNIKIPEGYQVVEYPESLNLVTQNAKGKFQFNSSLKEDNLQLRITFAIKDPFFNAYEYPFLREIYDRYIEKREEQIVLKKIN